MSRQVQQSNHKPTPLKDLYFQRPFFDMLTSKIQSVWPNFDDKRFFNLLYNNTWESLELKGRMRHACEALGATLPTDYPEALAILLTVEGEFDGFDHMLFADFVERFGLEHPAASLEALEQLTRSSSEFAIRPFILRYPEQTMERMRLWSLSASEHHRRLASEGSRPRLPWATALPPFKRDPSPILPILENIRTDPSEYVRRSVANNLNDIGKDHPEVVLALAKRWIKAAPETKQLLKHALRTQLKAGNKQALALFGLVNADKIEVESLQLTPNPLALGGSTNLTFKLVNQSRVTQSIRLEYRIDYARPGSKTGKKIFQLGEQTIAPSASKKISRQLDFQQRSTRTLYPGQHQLTVIVNGEAKAGVFFELTT